MEFVSANPTGPLHIGHTRWAALGDSIARVLTRLRRPRHASTTSTTPAPRWTTSAHSVLRRAARASRPPRAATRAQYIADLADRVLTGTPTSSSSTDGRRPRRWPGRPATSCSWPRSRSRSTKFNVHFDVWFSERSCTRSTATGRNAIDDAVDRLRDQGHVFDDRTARSGCAPPTSATTRTASSAARTASRTYFAADAAYYLNKGDRGFAHKIYLLGADHHGYINRLKALAGAAGDDPERDIEVLIGQLVSVNGARLSKRAGNIIELNDLQAWLGTDALRYSLARYPADSPLDPRPGAAAEAHQRQPGLLRAVRARPHPPGGQERRGVRRGPQRVRARDCSTHETESELLGVLGSSRASSPRRPSCASRTASPATSRNSPAPTTAGTTTAASRRSATSPSPTCTAPGCGSTTPPARCCATASTCSA